MPEIYPIDNSGIGGTPYLTFTVDATKDRDFTQDDLDSNHTACAISDSNKVGMGKDGDPLFGKCVWVSQQLQDNTTVPALCAVQARGCARFKYVQPAPVFGKGVVVNGEGKVKFHPEGSGKVMAIDDAAETCDVWLG